jgi:predicted dehydrogenase
MSTKPMTNPVNVGIIGAGNISSIYLEAPKKFDILNIAAVADIDMARAQAQAEKYGVQAVTVDALLADPSIELVINLTVPLAHGDVALQAVRAGKSVYTEKPLTYKKEQAQELLALAKQTGLLVGGAPDTFLGGGYQTCRELIDAGAIGAPVVGVAHMLSRGMEMWHPNPDFFFQPGGGPMFDLGPYYLTAFVALFGPAKRVAGMTRITHPERTITSQPLHGTKIKVNVPTCVTGTIEFANGALATMIMTWDVSEGYTPSLSIYGTQASMICPDPNTFGGPIKLKSTNDKEWRDMPVTRAWTENSRGLGVADMAHALRQGGGAHYRANGNMAYHVLELMHAFHESAATGKHIDIASTCELPQPLPANYP